MPMEYIDVLDENGVKTGEILSRKEIHQRGLWHRAIVIAIINENNEVLLQQRSINKDKNAGLWDISVAGHISTGQDAISAAAREINEEISVGIQAKVSITDFRYIFSYRVSQKFADDYVENQFYDFFILRKNSLRTKDITLQKSEVQDAKFVSLQELEEILQTDCILKRKPVYDALRDYLYRYWYIIELSHRERVFLRFL